MPTAIVINKDKVTPVSIDMTKMVELRKKVTNDRNMMDAVHYKARDVIDEKFRAHRKSLFASTASKVEVPEKPNPHEEPNPHEDMSEPKPLGVIRTIHNPDWAKRRADVTR